MLQVLSHQYLKKFVRSKSIDWGHIYSFGRIISNCIQHNATYLINSEIFSTTNWESAILINLFLQEENSTFVLSNEKIQFIKNSLLADLKTLGFNFVLEDDQIIFKKHRVSLLTFENLLKETKSYRFKNHRIVLSGVEDIKQDLKNHFRISLFKKDWFEKVKQTESFNQNVISTYNFLKNKFFLRKVLGKSYLLLDEEEISFLSNFFYENASFSNKFSSVSDALSKQWGCWVELDHQKLEWNFYLEPIDELYQIRELLINNKFIFLSVLRKDVFFQKYLKRQSLDIDLVINFKSNFSEKKISLYVPPKQLLPNNPRFINLIVDKCKKLIIFRKGMTLILSDDLDLKIHLATELASQYGKRVHLETIPSVSNEILCASHNWWINHSHLIQIPEQIILPLLPIPNMSEPINLIMVSHKKKHSKDWFREFLLPEALLKLERSISPLRRNSGKLIILDGRAKKRKWGRLLLQNIQPSEQINYLIPFD